MERVRDHALRAECMTTRTIPCHAAVLKRVAVCESVDGWLVDCETNGRYLALCRELVDALARQLRRLGEGRVLEVCAGDGELAASITATGTEVIATDRAPAAAGVHRMEATEALSFWQPKTVIGCFVPFDSGVDRAVLACPSVRHYVVLNARINGLLGDPMMWNVAGWSARPLLDVRQWMVTRHDVWMPRRPMLTRGEAWLFERDSGS